MIPDTVAAPGLASRGPSGYDLSLFNFTMRDARMPRGNSLLAYIPSRLLELLTHEPAPLPLPSWEERFEGAVLFVDVSGFTPLCETLTRQGAAGTERMTEILNRFYLWLVAAVENAGGFVARFNGDAITAILPGASAREAFQDAIYCGLELIQTAYRSPPELVDGLDFPLRVKVGISTGAIYAAAVGAAEGELRYFVGGRAVQEASMASTWCGPMELLIPAHLIEHLPPDVTTLEAPGQHLTVMHALLRRVTMLPPYKEPPRLEMPVGVPRSRIARFVPAQIDERLELGLSELVAEHRPVTVLFARFEGLDPDDPASSRPLQAFMDEVFQLVALHDGTVDKIEQADKGNIIMALFGAPRGLECPEAAAVACAVELRERFTARTGIEICGIGINTGLVYAGDVGAPWRHDYTVMGDAVNVASRLTSHANRGEIVVSTRVRNRAPGWLYAEPRTQAFKGKAEPVQMWPVLGTAETQTELDQDVIELPDRGDLLFGRETEVALLDRTIRRLRDGKPGLVVLEGDVGVGKSRLAGYVTEQVFAFGRVINQRNRPAVSVPFEFWQWPLLELLGGSGPDLDERLFRVFQRVDPQAAPWLALFNPVLGCAFPTTPPIEAADPRSRERMLLDMSATLLLHFASSTPLLIVLDDFHEADTASSALLRHLAMRLDEGALLLLVVARPGAPIPSAEGMLHFLRIGVNPLDKAALKALARLRLGPDVASKIVDMIWERSQGNPLFAEELLHTLKQLSSAHLNEGDEAGLAAIELPDSLRSVLQSRIDELPEAAKAVAKVAAVIGTRFSLPTLTAGFKEGTPPEFLQAQLDRLTGSRIILQRHHPTERTYEFRHVLSREVVYSGMTQTQQVELHRRIGAWLEQSGRMVSPNVLAHHFERGHDYAGAMRYHLQAAEQAFNAFANEEAIRGYERALILADEHWIPLPDGMTRAQVLEAQGDVHFRIGAYRKAEALYRKVRGIAPEWLSVVRCLRKEGDAKLRSDDVPNALRCLEEALLLLKAEKGLSLFGTILPIMFRVVRDRFKGPPSRPGTPPLEIERSRWIELDQVYSVLAVALYYEGSRQLVEVVYRMAEVALRLGEPGRIARAYASISFLYASLAVFKPAEQYSEAALQWIEKETDGVTRVRLRGNMTYALTGAARRIAADWPRAEALHLQGVATNQTIGDIWEEGLSLMNLAIMWRVRGYHHKAREMHARVIKMAEEVEQFLYLGEALVCDALCLAELGQFDEANAQLERALALPGLHLLGRVRAIAHRGWLKYLQGRPQAGMTDLNEAERLIRTRRMAGEHVSEILVWRLEVLVATGASRSKVTRAWLRAARAGSRLPSLRGSLAFVDGLIALKRGNKRRAIMKFAQASSLHKSVDRGREAARALLWQASVQRERAAVLRSEAAKLLRDRGTSEHPPGGPGSST